MHSKQQLPPHALQTCVSARQDQSHVAAVYRHQAGHQGHQAAAFNDALQSFRTPALTLLRSTGTRQDTKATSACLSSPPKVPSNIISVVSSSSVRVEPGGRGAEQLGQGRWRQSGLARGAGSRAGQAARPAPGQQQVHCTLCLPCALCVPPQTKWALTCGVNLAGRPPLKCHASIRFNEAQLAQHGGAVPALLLEAAVVGGGKRKDCTKFQPRGKACTKQWAALLGQSMPS